MPIAMRVTALLLAASLCSIARLPTGGRFPARRHSRRPRATRSTSAAWHTAAWRKSARTDDVPVLLAALWDEEELIRGMAEQAVWGIWMRTDDPAADPMFQTGIQLLIEEKPAQALEKFNQVIALKPEFAEVWNRRGDTYQFMGDEERALADYEHVMRLNPYHFGTLESCGQIWLERGNYRKAAEYFRQALEINPNLWNVAEILQRLEKSLENDRI